MAMILLHETDMIHPHPLRIQRRRTKGFRLPEHAVCVTRPGKWGNPFRIDSCLESGFAESEEQARIVCVESFEDWLLKGDLSYWWFDAERDKWEWMRKHLQDLYGRKLACFCSLDKPCHADVLAHYANQ